MVVLAIAAGILLATIIVDDRLHPHSKFIPYTDETNQPCCVVGAFCMYARETLNVELTPKLVEYQVPLLTNDGIEVGLIISSWNRLFSTNPLVSIDFSNDPIQFEKPYIWSGRWDNTNTYHTCLVYFHTNDVTFKHFVYDPNTHTNYMVRTNYEFFFDRILCLHTLR